MKSVGYKRLIEDYALSVLEPARISYIHERSEQRIVQSGTSLEVYYPQSYDPGMGWDKNLPFALKYEGINLEVLAAFFSALGPEPLRAFVAASPTGKYARITWFLYEFLTGTILDLPDADRGNYVPVLDEENVYALPLDIPGLKVRRHRVINNLPGTRAYCPIIRKTETLRAFEAEDFHVAIEERLRKYAPQIVQRATRYLYLKETKSSFEIEHECADEKRAHRFAELLRRAGKTEPYSETVLAALQRVIVEERYASQGFRTVQNYVGESIGPAREWVHYVPPKPEDIRELMEGWAKSCRSLRATPGNVVAFATVAGYGFVFLHPFEDGNGRLHRFLIHDALVAGGFTPEGMIFPVSAVMLKRLKEYDAALEAYSTKIMENISYTINAKGQLAVEGETSHFYRYPDLTLQAEALCTFIRETLDTELTSELEYLALFDAAKERVQSILDMPDHRLELFVRLCIQGKGKISASKRSLFPEIQDRELQELESAVVSEIEMRWQDKKQE